MSRAVLAEYTGLGERKLDRHLTKLVDRGVLGVDTDGGEMCWTVRGKPRDPTGAETLERFARVQRLRAEARAKVARQAENRRRRRAGLDELADPGDSDGDEPERRSRRDSQNDRDEDDDDGGGRSMIRAGAGVAKGALGLVAAAAAPLDSRQARGKKSLLLSAGLSFLGPLGWLYAGSFREAIPASLLYLGIAALLPKALLWPILWFALPISAIAGFVYAWQHNSNGQRTPLFLSSGKDDD